jgi:gluconate kinase
MRKPLIIYVSGAPGSGKTSLARLLSEQLYIPHVSSDLVHGGVRLTEGEKNDRKKNLINVFVPLLISMAKMNISFVVDHVLQKERSEKDIIQKLTPHAIIVYIHTRANNSIDRFYTRERLRNDRGIVLSDEELRVRKDFHKNNLVNTEEPLDLDIPRLEVTTNSGYEPAVSFILDFIEREYAKGEI